MNKEEPELVYGLNTMDDLRTVYFALAEYRDRLVKDIATCMDRNNRYGLEDEMFLAGTLGDVCRIMYDMESLPELDASAGRSMIYNPSGRAQVTLLNVDGLSKEQKKDQRAAFENGRNQEALREQLAEDAEIDRMDREEMAALEEADRQDEEERRQRIEAGVKDIERVAELDREAAEKAAWLGGHQ